MTLAGELNSLSTPEQPTLSEPPQIGEEAPMPSKLIEAHQREDGSHKPIMLTFLRHCGCPFAEKAFREFTALANRNRNIQFIAVSHSSEEDTGEWLVAVGGYGEVKVVCDPDRTIYAKYGLGLSSYWSVLSPSGIMDTINLAIAEGIKNKPTKSGYRWQTAGSFAISDDAVVVWRHISETAGDVSNFKEALETLKDAQEKKRAEGQVFDPSKNRARVQVEEQQADSRFSVE